MKKDKCAQRKSCLRFDGKQWVKMTREEAARFDAQQGQKFAPVAAVG